VNDERDGQDEQADEPDPPMREWLPGRIALIALATALAAAVFGFGFSWGERLRRCPSDELDARCAAACVESGHERGSYSDYSDDCTCFSSVPTPAPQEGP